MPDATGTHDGRVSAARITDNGPAAVLLTFGIEIAAVGRVLHRQLIAVLLPADGRPRAIEQPEDWLAFAAPDRAIAPDGLWQRHFESWVPKRRPQAERVATAAMQRVADDVIRTLRHHAERDSADLVRWLQLRADDICGVFKARTADLFGIVPDGPPWKSLRDPLDRLAAYAADGENPPAKRREANSAVALFRRRGEERAAHLTVSPPRLQPLGMLLLVPQGDRGQ